MQRFRRVAATILCFALAMTATPAPGVSRVQALSFADANNGWLGGWFPTQKGFVSYTTDGGASWTATSTADGPISSIVAGPSGTNAWATAGEYKSVAFAFTRTPFAWARNGQGSIIARAVPARIIRLAAGRLVAVGQAIDYFGSDLGEGLLNHGRVGFIATSDNGGVTWTKRWVGPLYAPLGDSGPPSTWASISDVAASPDGSTIYAIGNEWNASGSISTTFKRRFVLKSTDGGVTWGSQTSPPVVTGTTALNAVVAPSATVAYAFGNARTAIKTTNGSTWTALTTLPAFTVLSSNPHIVAADAVSTSTVVIAANRQRVKSTDPYTAQLARTTDGGVTWTTWSTAYATNIYAVRASSPTNWVAVGSNEHIIRSTDGGDSWSFPYGETAPYVTRTQPTANFSYASGPVAISGTANDTTGLTPGVGVRAVDVRIRRADGKSWNGIAWVDPETWVPATTANGWANWSYTWTPDASLLAAPQIVTITARATDGIGLSRQSTTVSSRVDVGTSVSIAEGAPYSTSTTVTVAVSAPGATRMRWKVDGGSFPAEWVSIAETSSVPLGAGEGERAVTFEFDDDVPATVFTPASDTITVDTQAPSVTRTAPADTQEASGTQGISVKATLADAGSGVAGAEYSVRRSDGYYWAGEGWSQQAAWLPMKDDAGVTGGYFETWKPDEDFLELGRSATVTVRGFDEAGNAGTSSSATVTATAQRAPNVAITSPKAGYYITSTAVQTVRGTISDALSRVTAVDVSIRRSDGRWWSGGSWVTTQRWIAVPVTEGATSWSTTWRPDSAFVASGRSVTIFARAKDAYGNERVSASVSSKARVKASLTRPSMATYTLVRGRGYRATGTLKPRHTAGTYPVRVQAYRLVNGKYRYWGSFRAKATDVTGGSRYTATVKLPYKGKWRLRAYHSDTPHLPTYSTWRYVTVR